MPKWTSMAAFGRDLNKWAVEFERTEAQKITRKLGKHAQKIAEEEAARDVGSDREMRGWPGPMDTKLREIKTGHVFQPTKPAAGKWTEKERGRNVGETGRFLGPGATLSGGAIRRRNDGSVARRGARRGRRWNGVTKGKGTATRVVLRMERELPEIAADDFKRVLKRSFDVT